jgi:peroxiredoxin
VARPERLELPTLWFEARCSIQLSYGRANPLYPFNKPWVPASRPRSVQSTISVTFSSPTSGWRLSTVNFLSRYTEAMGILRRLTRWMGKQEQMTNIVTGNIAPNFSLKSLDGKEYSLNKLMERGPVVAAFFKVSCPVCQFTFPFLERLYKRYGGDGVTFLGISQDDARATKTFAKEYGLTFPMLIDDESGYLVSNAYGLTNVPTTFLIDTEGKVKISGMGFDKKDLETIAAELAERKKISLAPLFRPDEVVPANKPG